MIPFKKWEDRPSISVRRCFIMIKIIFLNSNTQKKFEKNDQIFPCLIIAFVYVVNLV